MHPFRLYSVLRKLVTVLSSGVMLLAFAAAACAIFGWYGLGALAGLLAFPRILKPSKRRRAGDFLLASLQGALLCSAVALVAALLQEGLLADIRTWLVSWMQTGQPAEEIVLNGHPYRLSEVIQYVLSGGDGLSVGTVDSFELSLAGLGAMLSAGIGTLLMTLSTVIRGAFSSVPQGHASGHQWGTHAAGYRWSDVDVGDPIGASTDDLFESSRATSSSHGLWDDDACSGHHSSINPATGLPMMGCVDVAGNPYGFDNSSSLHADDWHQNIWSHDDIGSSHWND